jgi:DNA-directed RNA polymerase sigma subunit (sigma70/sigma32)
MALSELEAALVDRARAQSDARTPEMLANRLGVSLAEVREAEKTALRQLANPGELDPRSLDDLDLTQLEYEVLRFLYCDNGNWTPEDMARHFDVPLLTVLEAQKEAMRHVQGKPANDHDVDAA